MKLIRYVRFTELSLSHICCLPTMCNGPFYYSASVTEKEKARGHRTYPVREYFDTFLCRCIYSIRAKLPHGTVLRSQFVCVKVLRSIARTSEKVGRAFSFRAPLCFPEQGLADICIRRAVVLHEICNKAATTSELQ